jgi:hypothetical protein
MPPANRSRSRPKLFPEETEWQLHRNVSCASGIDLFVPVRKPQVAQLLRKLHERQTRILEKSGYSLFICAITGEVLAARFHDCRSPTNKEPIRHIAFTNHSPPFSIAINGKEGTLNALPFAVLHCVLACAATQRMKPWPKGRELAAKTATLRSRIEARYTQSNSDLEDVWPSWLNQTRKALVASFPWISALDLLPDGKASRKIGLHPKLASGCEIIGVDETIWSPRK